MKICSNEFSVVSCRHNKAHMKIFQMLQTLPNNVRNVRITHHCGGRSRNVCTSSAIPTAWYDFTRRELFYGDLMSPETMKVLRYSRKVPDLDSLDRYS
jgi:hypothetical protein